MPVTILDAWEGTNDFPTDGRSHAASPGNNRAGIVCISHEMEGGGGMSIGTITWGGETVTEIHDLTVGVITTFHNLVFMGYVTEANILAMSGSALSITFTNGNGGVGAFDNAKVYTAFYENVNQSNINSASAAATGDPSASLSPGSIDVDVDEQVVAFVLNGDGLFTVAGGTGYSEEIGFIGGTNGHVSSVFTRDATTNDDTHDVAHTSSTTFRMISANVSLGFIVAPVHDQEAFRFYADGTESGAAALANQNVDLSIDKETVFGLRQGTQLTNDPSARSVTVEYKKTGDADAEYRKLL